MNIGPLAVRMSSQVIGSVGDTRCSAHQCSPVAGLGLQHRPLQGVDSPMQVTYFDGRDLSLIHPGEVNG